MFWLRHQRYQERSYHTETAKSNLQIRRRLLQNSRCVLYGLKWVALSILLGLPGTEVGHTFAIGISTTLDPSVYVSGSTGPVAEPCLEYVS